MEPAGRVGRNFVGNASPSPPCLTRPCPITRSGWRRPVREAGGVGRRGRGASEAVVEPAVGFGLRFCGQVGSRDLAADTASGIGRPGRGAIEAVVERGRSGRRGYVGHGVLHQRSQSTTGPLGWRTASAPASRSASPSPRDRHGLVGTRDRAAGPLSARRVGGIGKVAAPSEAAVEPALVLAVGSQGLGRPLSWSLDIACDDHGPPSPSRARRGRGRPSRNLARLHAGLAGGPTARTGPVSRGHGAGSSGRHWSRRTRFPARLMAPLLEPVGG